MSSNHPEWKDNEEALQPEDDEVHLVKGGGEVPEHFSRSEQEGDRQNTTKNKPTLFPETNLSKI